MAVTLLFSVISRGRHEALTAANMPIAGTATPAPVVLPFTLIRQDHTNTPIKDQRSRTIMLRKNATREEVRDTLLAYYGSIRSELSQSDNDTKHIYIYAFDDERRANRGDGEWIGMAMAQSFNGRSLPQQPQISLKVPDPAAEAPTAEEQAIYDEFLDALAATPLEQKGSTESEAHIKRLVAKRHGLSANQMTDLWKRVFTYRNTPDR
jgi:hypothetical protein